MPSAPEWDTTGYYLVEVEVSANLAAASPGTLTGVSSGRHIVVSQYEGLANKVIVVVTHHEIVGLGRRILIDRFNDAPFSALRAAGRPT